MARSPPQSTAAGRFLPVARGGMLQGMVRRELARYGWDASFEEEWGRLAPRADAEPARVVIEHKAGYLLQRESGEAAGTLAGRLRLALERGDSDRPAVGDWVAITAPSDADAALVHAVLPRRTRLLRKAAGRQTIEQVLAANVDVVLVVAGLDAGPNPRRIERFITVAREGGAKPVVVLNKADACADPAGALAAVEAVAAGAPIHVVSAVTGQGLGELGAHLGEGRTTALIGPSGVGKSTLLNTWLGYQRQATRAIRRDSKGRHTTTRRELVVLPRGGILIDTPGIRELAPWEEDAGLEQAFIDLDELAAGCRFRDCRHLREPGCAVRAAVADGRLHADRLEGFLRLAREVEHTGRQRDERARSAGKRNEKVLARAVRARLRDKGRR